MSNFHNELLSEVINNIGNDHADNRDEYRFGASEKTLKHQLVKRVLSARGQALIQPDSIKNCYSNVEPYLERLNELYELLADEKSKQTLVKLIAYRILGERKVKLPLNTPEYRQWLERLEKIEDKQDFLQIKFENWKLNKADLNKINYPIQIYLVPHGIYTAFVLRQYEYRNGNFAVKAAPGDYVLDCGGCWGDTTLYFANEVSEKGKVIAFEFIPSNIEILRKNLALNPELEKRVEVVEKPVWNESNVELYYNDNGPASKVGFTPQNAQKDKVRTLSIDDMNLEKIDFIKMDIEGAEPNALDGARLTLEKFKPKLAVAIYHSLDDFVEIPRLLDSLGYKLYLGHYTIHLEETILFAV